jgi:NADH:ubiquinone oxidoreductase subunit 2 (subunit N)
VGLMILYNVFYINIFSQINRINFFDKICMVLIFMSLGGLPPLLGFLRKFLVVKFILISSNRIYFIMIVVFSSLFLLYFYISRIYFYLTYIPSLKMNLKIRHVLIKKYLYIISLLIINSFLLVNL